MLDLETPIQQEWRRAKRRRSSADEPADRPYKIQRTPRGQIDSPEEEVQRVGTAECLKQLPSPESQEPPQAAEPYHPHQATRSCFSGESASRKRKRSIPRDTDSPSVVGTWLEHLPATPDFEDMSRPPKRSKSSDSLARVPSLSGGASESTVSRDAKYSAYKDTNYAVVLETKNSFMRPSQDGMIEEDRQLCQRLLHEDRVTPSNTLFDDKRFESFCSLLPGRSESRVYLDLHPLLVPSAENLYISGHSELENLIQGYNDQWVKAISFYGPRPQPDHTVGFKWSTFNEEERRKLGIDPVEKSLYTAREDIYFPFFTSEIKCGKQALDLADRPNAHSMTIALRGIVDLYRRIGRPADVHRRLLGLSISHDDNIVRINVHYPVIQGDETFYHRETIKHYSYKDDNGKQRWTAFKFTVNAYHIFAQRLLTVIKSAIERLPDPVLDPVETIPGLEEESTLSSQESGLSASESQGGDLRRSRKAGGLNAELRTMIQNLQRQLEQQREREANLAEQLQRQQELAQQQLQQQRKESEQQRKESEQQRKELMELLSQQSEQLRQLLKH